MAVIEKSRIVSEHTNTLRRAVLFKGAEKEVEEVVDFVEPMKVCPLSPVPLIHVLVR